MNQPHKSHNAFDGYATIHHISTHIDISVAKVCIVGSLTCALWDSDFGLLLNITLMHHQKGIVVFPNELNSNGCAQKHLPKYFISLQSVYTGVIL